MNWRSLGYPKLHSLHKAGMKWVDIPVIKAMNCITCMWTIRLNACDGFECVCMGTRKHGAGQHARAPSAALGQTRLQRTWRFLLSRSRCMRCVWSLKYLQKGGTWEGQGGAWKGRSVECRSRPNSLL